MFPSKEQAETVFKKYTQDPALLRHGYQVAGVMEHLAYFWDQPQEATKWAIVGLLHDLDYEQFPQEHCQKVEELLQENQISDSELIRAIQSHGYGMCSQVKPESLMEKNLYAIDELTGLIYAVSLMRPSKSFDDLETKSVKKKFKDKSFAAGVDRKIITDGAAMLEIELEKLMQEVILGLRKLEK